MINTQGTEEGAPIKVAEPFLAKESQVLHSAVFQPQILLYQRIQKSTWIHVIPAMMLMAQFGFGLESLSIPLCVEHKAGKW